MDGSGGAAARPKHNTQDVHTDQPSFALLSKTNFGRAALSNHTLVNLSFMADVAVFHAVALELCVDSVASAIAAHAGGASRLELCDNLVEGGTTPSIGLVKAVLRSVPAVSVHVMIRPRGGDFLYSKAELDVMTEDIVNIKAAGAHGIVLGVLSPDGRVDESALRRLVTLAAPLPVTFHRAIDVSTDPVAATHACVRCGVARILSSGGAATAEAGCETLRRMVQAAEGRLVIAAGGGVSEANAATIARRSGVDELHGSLRTTRRSAMTFRPRVPIPMGSEKLNGPETEYETKEASAQRVSAVVRALAAVPAPVRCASTPTINACGSGSSSSRRRHESLSDGTSGRTTITPYAGCLYVLFLVGVAAAVAFHGSGSRWARLLRSRWLDLTFMTGRTRHLPHRG